MYSGVKMHSGVEVYSGTEIPHEVVKVAVISQ